MNSVETDSEVYQAFLMEASKFNGETFEFDTGINDESYQSSEPDDLIDCESLKYPFVSITEGVVAEGQDNAMMNLSGIQSIPRVMKNDIRRSFPRMHFNMLNSGDFSHLQDYMQTFMLPTCTFETKILNKMINNLPTSIQGMGPQMHIHYVLGFFTMCPDAVFTILGESQVVTSNMWPGSKIIIPFESRGGLTFSIPQECWTPPADKVAQMYEESSIEGMLSVLSLDNPPDSAPAQIETTQETTVQFTSTKAEKKRKRQVDAVRQNGEKLLVPTSYRDVLTAGATRLDNPGQLYFQGQCIFFLDENHQIRSITMKVISK